MLDEQYFPDIQGDKARSTCTNAICRLRPIRRRAFTDTYDEGKPSHEPIRQVAPPRRGKQIRSLPQAEHTWQPHGQPAVGLGVEPARPAVSRSPRRRPQDGLPDNSVDLIVTSPPYWNKRDYGHSDQIGLEPTPELTSPPSWSASTEWRRVLRPHGSVFLNVGDTYFNKSLLGHPRADRVAGRQGRLAHPQPDHLGQGVGHAGPGEEPSRQPPRVRHPPDLQAELLLRPCRLLRGVRQRREPGRRLDDQPRAEHGRSTSRPTRASSFAARSRWRRPRRSAPTCSVPRRRVIERTAELDPTRPQAQARHGAGQGARPDARAHPRHPGVRGLRRRQGDEVPERHRPQQPRGAAARGRGQGRARRLLPRVHVREEAHRRLDRLRPRHAGARRRARPVRGYRDDAQDGHRGGPRRHRRRPRELDGSPGHSAAEPIRPARPATVVAMSASAASMPSSEDRSSR